MKFDLVEFPRKIKSDKTSGKYPQPLFNVLYPPSRGNLLRLPANIYILYVYTQCRIFLPGTLLTIVTERERERERERGREEEWKRDNGGFIYRYGAV